MHEAGIAQEVLNACVAQLRAYGAVRVTSVGLQIGARSSVDPAALQFCFDELKRDTVLHSAVLDVDRRSRFGCSCQDTDPDIGTCPDVCPICGAAESLADACSLEIRYLEFDRRSDK